MYNNHQTDHIERNEKKKSMYSKREHTQTSLHHNVLWHIYPHIRTHTHTHMMQVCKKQTDI